MLKQLLLHHPLMCLPLPDVANHYCKAHMLTSSRLVATIGNRSSTRRVSKKAIQGVNVQKACGKILQPGAPIALRLQGNLLYGVSRVYRQQCDYMLNDAQRVQSNLELYFKRTGSNQLDQDKAKPR